MLDMKRRLKQAQAGDEEATSDVALYVFNKYRSRIVQLARQSLDPAITLEDMEASFFIAILEAVQIADGRGCDFYHIGQRGVWAVQTELRVLQRQMSCRTLHPDWADVPEYERVVDRCAEDFCEVVERRVDGELMVEIIANTTLSGPCRQAIDVIVREGLDPNELGFNKTLAGHMGVSPQRTSQILKDVREALT